MLVGRRIDFCDVCIFGHEIDDLFFQQSILDVADLIVFRQLLDVGLWILAHLLSLHCDHAQDFFSGNLEFLLLHDLLVGEEPAEAIDGRGIGFGGDAAAFVEAQRESLAAAIPAGRLGASNDIAAACVYLASDEAAYVTGQTLHVNGGMAMV